MPGTAAGVDGGFPITAFYGALLVVTQVDNGGFTEGQSFDQFFWFHRSSLISF
jgi:hypothetical protein